MHFITKAAEDIGKTAQVCSSSDDTSIWTLWFDLFNYLQCNVRWVWCLFLNFLGGITVKIEMWERQVKVLEPSIDWIILNWFIQLIFE